MKQRLSLNLYFILTLFIFLCGCSSSNQPKERIKADETVVSLAQRYTKETVIMAGDQLEVSVYRNAELSRTVVVRNDGHFSMPLLGDVAAAGKTISQLNTEVTERFAKRLRNPEVNIALLNPPEPMVYVFGEVGVVKPVPLRQARTLAQAIAYSSGINRDAAKKDVFLIRLNNEGYLTTRQVNQDISGGSAEYVAFQNTPLMADDLIVVPEGKRSIVRRFIQDFITNPFSAINQILTPYFQLLLLDEVRKSN